MNRFVLVSALLVGACGSATDDRPPTLDYITETILAPSCAVAECHSAFKREVGDQFDTPDAARHTIVAYGLAVPGDKDSPANAQLILAVTVGLPSVIDKSEGLQRMPYDAPLPDADINLMKAWIALGVPGAQCEPDAQKHGCAFATDGSQNVVQCIDGNIGDVVTMCSSGCDTSSGNAQCSQ
jgi:hypothetical protein